MRVLAVVVMISCARGTPPPTLPPAPLANVGAVPQSDEVATVPDDDELAKLAFLDGCWQYWSVDWGVEVCWRRDKARWLGKYRSFGSMGPKETIGLIVWRHHDELVMDVRRKTPRHDEHERDQLFATMRGPSYVVFGAMEFLMIARGPDEIDAQLGAGRGRYRLTRNPY